MIWKPIFRPRLAGFSLMAAVAGIIPLQCFSQSCPVPGPTWVWQYNNDYQVGIAATATEGCNAFNGAQIPYIITTATITATVAPGSQQYPTSYSSSASCVTYFSWPAYSDPQNPNIIYPGGAAPEGNVGLYPIQLSSTTCPEFWVESQPASLNQVTNKDHVGEPINPAVGNVYTTETDVSFYGAGGIAYRRYFNSADIAGSDGVPGWRHSYDRSINVVYQALTTTYPGASATVSPQYPTPQAACQTGFSTIQGSVSAWQNASAAYNNGVCVLSNGSGS